MSKLLRGDFARLFRSNIFWLGVIFMLGAAVFTVFLDWTRLQQMQHYYPYKAPPDRSLLQGAMLFLGIVISIFVGLFVGTDYRCGTIRNKLIMGHSRVAMYFSNLTVCLITSLILHFEYIAVIIGASAVGITDKFDMSAEDILIDTLICTCSVLAMTSVILLLCMLISSRTLSTVVVLVLSIMSLFAAQFVDGIRYTGEFVEIVLPDGTTAMDYTYIDDMSTKGRIIKFVNDYIPENQIYQLENRKPSDFYADLPKVDKEIFPLYSLSLIVLSTTAGILVFRKKDLK